MIDEEHPISNGDEEDVPPVEHVNSSEFDTFPQFGPHRNRGSAVSINPETVIPDQSQTEDEKKSVLADLQEPLFSGSKMLDLFQVSQGQRSQPMSIY
jgi:hypothetical protein